MSQINGLGFNPNYPQKIEKKENEQQEAKQIETPQAEQKPQVSPNQVFEFMANSNVPLNINKPTKTLDISKYVTPEQAARIGGFINSFESAVVENLKAMESSPEFANLSDEAKLNVAVGAFAKTNMPE